MKKTIDVTWSDNMKFSTELDGHKLVLDAAVDNGGSDAGPRPKVLMMVALAGCTGMDVVSILAKMRVDLSYFNLKVEGDINDEHPKKFKSMKVIYEFKGENLEYEKLEKAVKLSVEKYCGVNANYKDAMKMDYEIRVL
jgi:Predicted redox protein, regulator of disulfide bond formation